MNPDYRCENLRVTVRLDKDQYQQYEQEMQALMKKHFFMNVGDVVTVTYDFKAEYYGVVRSFEALITLLNDPRLDIVADLSELRGLNCLIQDLILAIEGRSYGNHDVRKSSGGGQVSDSTCP